jgi:hypothetical protein
MDGVGCEGGVLYDLELRPLEVTGVVGYVESHVMSCYDGYCF